MSKSQIKAADFFVIRTPRMPLDSLFNIGTSEQQTRQALQDWLAQPAVIEALYLASPSLLERVDPEKTTPKQQKKLEQALLKYMIRMCSRPTPFGLFSGIHHGKMAPSSRFISDDLIADSRKTRLDVFYLSALKAHLLENSPEPENSPELAIQYYPNSSHYFVADNYRYIEAYQSDETRQYRLSAVQRDEHFDFVLAQTKQGSSFNALVDAFLSQFSTADTNEEEAQERNEIKDYIQELINESVIIADIPLPLTGDAPDKALIDSLNQIGETNTADHLSTVLHQLQTLDSNKSGEVGDYQQALAHLNQLPVKAKENKLFQTDVYRAFSHCELDQSLPTRLMKQLRLIASFSVKRNEPLSDFISKFNQRFEGQFVALNRLLDDESGISVSNESGYEAPLLAGVQLNSLRTTQGQRTAPSALDKLITQTISTPENRNKQVVQLSSKMLTAQLNEQQSKLLADSELPASFATMIALFEDPQGQPLIKFNGCYGPSAANLLGRFCHLDENLKAQVISHLDQESAHSPEVIFAEINHMPEGRPGNVIARPHLRQYEIVFLADSSLADEYQITLNDLYVWIEGKQVKLWSKRLNKQIIPRLSSAHNYSSRSLGAYKFLSMLQHQAITLPRFSLPDSQADASFVPRVMLDNLILSEKTWRIPRKKLESLDENQWLALKTRYQLDDQLAFARRDNVLQLNLGNPIMRDILLAETRGDLMVELTEVLATQYSTPVKAIDGQKYANELIIPFFNAGATVQRHFNDDPQANIEANTEAKAIKRRFSPGSPWLSVKIYGGNTAIETLLTDHLLPLINDNQASYEKWFFIRYGDPDWHIRLRFYGEPAVLCGQLLPTLNQLLDPMIESGEIHKAELFTYEREVERYGGPNAMALVESLFMADSQLIAETVASIAEFGEDIRWRVAMQMTDKLLNAFGLDADEKLGLISRLRAGFGKEFNDSSRLRKQLGVKFNDHQTQLLADFDHTNSDEALFGLINDWYQQAQPHIDALNQLFQQGDVKCSKDTLLSSVLHMHNNRLFKAYSREHELLMHDFLRRLLVRQAHTDKKS